MAPFGFHRPAFGKKKHQPTGVTQEVIIEEPHSTLSQAYSLGTDHPQQVHMITQVPAKKPSRWKSVLRKKTTQPQVIDTIVPLHDRAFLDSDDYAHHTGGHHTVTGPHVTPHPTELHVGGSSVHGYDHPIHHQQQIHHSHRSHSSSGSSSGSDGHHRSGLQRQGTGHSRSHTIGPGDSASNVHYVYPQATGQQLPLQGIVEELSDADYERRSGSMRDAHHHRVNVVRGPTIISGHEPVRVVEHSEHGERIDLPGEFQTHEIGRGMHLHQGARRPNERLAPMQVTDAHGRRQNIQEILLDGSGVQEIPMPADGNVIFIVEEGVTLDVKDPETGEYIPLEEYYQRLAERTPPKQPDRYIVVNGDASNIIVEDADGQILHRGERVKSQFIRDRVVERSHSRSGSERSHRGSERSGQYSQHIIDRKGNQITIKHPQRDPQLRLYVQDEAGLRPNLDHLVITSPPAHHTNFATPRVVHVPHRSGSPRSTNSSSRSSSRSRSRSKRSSSSGDRVKVQIASSELVTTPEASLVGKPLVVDLGDGGHGQGVGVYMSAIPEQSREFLPSHHERKRSLASLVPSQRTGGGASFVVGTPASGKRSMDIIGTPGKRSIEVVRTGATPGSEFGQLPPDVIIQQQTGSPRHTLGSVKGRTPSFSTKSLKSLHAVATGGGSDPRTSNAVSFADHAMYINPPLDASSVSGTQEVVPLSAQHTPRSLRAGTPGVALQNLPPESPAQHSELLVVEEQPTGGFMKMPSPDVVPVEMVALKDEPIPLTKKARMAAAKKGGKKSKVVDLAPEPEAETVVLRNLGTGGTGNVDLGSPPATPNVGGWGFGGGESASRNHTGQDYFAGGFGGTGFGDAPGGGGLSRNPSVRSNAPGLGLGSPGQGVAPQLTGSYSPHVQLRSAQPSPHPSTRDLMGGGRQTPPVISRVASPVGSFRVDAPGGWNSSPPYNGAMAMPEVPPVVEYQNTGAMSSQNTGAVRSQYTGGPMSSHHTGGPMSSQRTGGPMSSHHTGAQVSSHQTGGTRPMVSAHNTGVPMSAQNTGVPMSAQNTGVPMSVQNTGPAPISAQSTGRRPSLADRMRSAVSSRLPSPTRGSKTLDPIRQSPLYNPQSDLLDAGGFAAVPSIHESANSKRNTTNSGNMSFVQTPLGGEEDPWGLRGGGDGASPMLMPLPEVGGGAAAAEAEAERLRDEEAAIGQAAAAAEAEAVALKEKEEEEDWAKPVKKGKKTTKKGKK